MILILFSISLMELFDGTSFNNIKEDNKPEQLANSFKLPVLKPTTGKPQDIASMTELGQGGLGSKHK